MIPNTEISERLNERGVSPVIGVILMVAITVILAAVIGAFVMDLGGNVSQNPQAGISFQESSGSLTITVNSAPRADSIEWKKASGTGWTSISATAGSTSNSFSVSDGDTILVRATYNGETAVVAEYEA